MRGRKRRRGERARNKRSGRRRIRIRQRNNRLSFRFRVPSLQTRFVWKPETGHSKLVEQIFPPLIIRAAHQAHNVATGVEVESAWLTHQLHAGFGGELISLAAVVGMGGSPP